MRTVLRKHKIRTIFGLVVVTLAVIGYFNRVAVLRLLVYQKPFVIGEQFHDAIREKCDRIVVRDGGFNCCGKNVDKQKILYETTDSEEIANFFARLHFMPVENSMTCLCCGFPGIDFYHGTKRLALTAVQHGTGLRWKGFSPFHILGFQVGYADAPLTTESVEWLARWLEKAGVPEERQEVVRKEKMTMKLR